MTMKAGPRFRSGRPTESASTIRRGGEPRRGERAFIRQWTLAEHRAALCDPDFAHRIVESTAVGALPGAGAWRPAAARPEPVGYVILLGLASRTSASSSSAWS